MATRHAVGEGVAAVLLATAALAIVACGGKKAPSAGAGSGSGSGNAVTAAAEPSADAQPTAATAAAAKPPAFEHAAPADPVVDLFADCATRASGHVDCWDGADGKVQRVGDVDDALALRPAPHVSSADLCLLRRTGVDCGDAKFPGITDAVDIATGSPVCVLRKSGAVACRDERGHVAAVPKLADAIAIVSTGSLTCAVERSGAVQCVSDAEPRRWHVLGGLANVRALALSRATGTGGAYDTYACAIHADSELRCYYVAGHVGTAAMRATPMRDADQPALDLGQFHGASAVAMASESDGAQPVAIVEGTVVVFDGNHTRTLANLVDATKITARCALRAQGSVVCWDGDGQPVAVPL